MNYRLGNEFQPPAAATPLFSPSLSATPLFSAPSAGRFARCLSRATPATAICRHAVSRRDTPSRATPSRAMSRREPTRVSRHATFVPLPSPGHASVPPRRHATAAGVFSSFLHATPHTEIPRLDTIFHARDRPSPRPPAVIPREGRRRRHATHTYALSFHV